MRRGARLVGVLTAAMTLGASVASAQVFGPPAAINANAATDGINDLEGPGTVAAAGAGSWLAVWSTNLGLAPTNLVVARSLDDGVSWTELAVLDSSVAPDKADDSGARIVTDGMGTWVLAAGSRVTSVSPSEFGVTAARSVDGGTTWTDLTTLSNDGTLDLRPSIATDGMGAWVVVWDSDDTLGGTIGSDRDILVSRSVDDGLTWSPAAALDSNAAADGATDNDSYVAGDGAGTLMAVWGSDSGIMVARSEDGGATWSAPVVLSSAGGFGTHLATDGAGTWVAVWESNDTLGGTIEADYDILVARSTDDGGTWTPAAPLNTTAEADSGDTLASADLDPEVTTDGAGTWVTVWRLGNQGTSTPDYEVLFAQSTDGGLTWTNPAFLNDALSDKGHDFNPKVATDGAGRWVAMWSSQDTLGGTIGTDSDVLRVTGSTTVATGVAASKLLVVDKLGSSGAAKTVFVAKDQSGAIEKGAGAFTNGIDVELEIAYATGSVTGAFVVPSGTSDGTSGWVVNKTKVAKYVNRLAPSGATEAKLAVIKPGKLLKLVGKGIGDMPIDVVTAGAPAGGVRTRFCVNNDAARVCHCSTFPECAHKPIAGGTGAKLVCKNGMPDQSCTTD